MKIIKPTRNLTVLILMVSFSLHAKIIFKDTFEAGCWRAGNNSGSSGGSCSKGVRWNQSQMQGGYSGKVVTDPVRAGTHAMRFEWRKSGYSGSNTSKKAHLNGLKVKPKGRYWYGFSIYFPKEGMKKDSYPEIVAQWHATPDPGEGWHGCGPFMCLAVRSDSLLFAYRGSSAAKLSCRGGSKSPIQSTEVFLRMVPKDRWIDFVIDVTFDPFGNGKIKCWMDGVPVFKNDKHPIGYNDKTGGYLCIGIYKFTGKSDHAVRVNLLDEIRIGDASSTYEDVAPGGESPKTTPVIVPPVDPRRASMATIRQNDAGGLVIIKMPMTRHAPGVSMALDGSVHREPCGRFVPIVLGK